MNLEDGTSDSPSSRVLHVIYSSETLVGVNTDMYDIRDSQLLP